MKYILLSCLYLGSFFAVQAQNNLWIDINFEAQNLQGEQSIFPNQYRSVSLDYFQLKDLLFTAPLYDITQNNVLNSPIQVSIPLPDGSSEIFKIVESPVYQEGLLDNFPGIKTFLAYCPEHPEWYSRFDITPQGFHAMIMGTENGSIFIDPISHLGLDKDKYFVYYKKDFTKPGESFVCLVDDKAPINSPSNNQSNSGTTKMFGTCELRTYRLAISATGEYTAFHGGTVANALAAQVTTMNRVNGVFERDMSIHMDLIANNNLIIYTNAGTDPFTNGNTGAMINENQTNTNAVIGSANYDIGHIFGTNSGGLAQLNSPCGTGKARGVTGSGAPVGDPFDIDYVAHEMGHQFGATHTQNNNCNRTNATAVEPGSASTIMGYANICAPNVQGASDDYFHGISMEQMGNFITGFGNTCAVQTPLGNTAPVASTPSASYVIPANTPFSLTASAIDPNANTLTYCWEQMDNEIAPMPPVANTGDGPSFRSFDPSTSPTRYFPNLPAVIAGTTPTWEVLSSVTRNMNFRVVVRDNAAGGGCNDHVDITVDVDGNSGPFIVLNPSANGITWTGNTNQTVTWDVANTNNAPVSCANVNILISYNGGTSFPDTLATNVPNDGNQSIIVPNIGTSNALVIVQCANGTFYDVSNNTFTITPIINDFIFSVVNANDTICVGEVATYDLNIGILGTFTDLVSIGTSGLPAGITTTFSSNNLAPSFTPTLTLGNTGAVAPGTYNFTIEATSTTGTKSLNASLVIIPNLSGPLTLTSPANGATGLGSPLTFTWSNIAGANYTFTLADNASLSSVVETSNVGSASFTSGLLAPNTTYYWQVEAYNDCDTLTSATFSFTTENCAIYASSDIPVAISSSGTPTITSNLLISGSIGTINDLNVVSLSGTHSYIQDLTFTLTSPNGTAVILLDNICAGQNNFNIQFDDAALNNNYPCPPTSGASFIPEESLSAFNGEDANGTWVLTVSDNANVDGGSLNQWGIEICLDPPVPCTTLFDTTLVNACDSALINGTWYFNSALVSDSLIASNSCDSVFTTNLSINSSSPETIINQTTCSAASVGSSSVTLTNTAGCDSVVTTNTTLLNGGTGLVTLTACDSTIVNGTTYFNTTTFNDTLTNASTNGCDSIVTYTLTINNSANTNETITACDSVQINGTWYFSSQVITQNLTATNTCDSTHTINLIINNNQATNTTLVACDSAQVNGTWYFNSQQVNNTFTASNNCDSTHTVDLTINFSSPETIINQTTCSAASVGSSSITLTNTAGCDSVVTTNTTLLNGGTGLVTLTACDSTIVNGTTYFNTTTFNDTLTNASTNGCDSIVTYTLTINNSAITNETITACDSVQINGTWYFSSQVITQNLTATNTCDSTHTINLIINNSQATNTTLVACDSAQVNGTWYFNSQQVNNTFTASNNCDSTHTVDLTINFSSPETIINQTTCSAASVGSSSVTLTNTSGCDSVVTTNTTLLNGGTGLVTLTACDSTIVNGTTYFNTTTFNDTLTNASTNGCDSIVTYTLTINNSANTNETITACDSVQINGTWYFGSQVITQNLTATNTCDSTHTINLIINNSQATNTTLVACDSAQVNGTWYFNSQQVNNTFTASNNCDSTHTVDLTINFSSPETIINQTTCSAASVGSSSVTLTNTSGCDSVVTTNTSLITGVIGNANLVACDSVLLNGTWYFSNTIINDTISGGASNGCDSITTFNITINNSVTTNAGLSACDSAQLNGTWYFTSQQLSQTFTGSNTCDSTHTIDLTINFSSTPSVVNQTTCDAAQVGTVTNTFTNSAGCDSIVTITTSLLSASFGTSNITACDSAQVNGTWYFTSISLNDTLIGASSNACDSIVTYNLTINNSVNTNASITACDSILIAGTWYTTSQVLTQNLTASNACDSTHIINLTINNSSAGTDVQTACETYTWIDGITYTTTTNTPTFTLINAAGCDSIVSLDLTINNASVGIDVQSACESFTWIDGNTYIASTNTPSFVIPGGAANACDSIVQLNLTIDYNEGITYVLSECDSYTWINGVTYTSNTNQSIIVPGATASGCDSLYFLQLEILTSDLDTAVVTACGSYTWIDGFTYTNSNNTASFFNQSGAANGCDLTSYLDLTILPIPEITILNNNGTLEATPGLTDYQWFRNGLIIAGATASSFTPTSFGAYSCQSDNGSCIGISNEIAIGITGITDPGFEAVSIYPNPSTAMLNIDLGGTSLSSLKIYDLNGKLVRNLDINQSQFNMSDYARGLYFIELLNEDQRKIVKLILE